MRISNDMNNYILQEFWDEKHGGFYTSINRKKEELITSDKLLVNLALGILTYTELKDEVTVIKLLSSVKDFEDPDARGYVELIDATNSVHPVGMVKTSCVQILMGYALWSAGLFLKEDEVKVSALKYVKFVADKYFEYENASVFMPDWKDVVDDSISLLDISVVCYVLSKMGLINYLNSDVILQLFGFVDRKKGAYSYVDKTGKPKTIKGKNLIDMAMLCLALIELSDKLDDVRYLEEVIDIFDFIITNMKCDLFGGFWNKCAADGRIQMNPLDAYYNKKESPFPYMSILDEAVLLIASSRMQPLIQAAGVDVVEEIISETTRSLSEYYDSKNKGFFMGKACWFSGPTSPSVPLARLAMVPQHTPGAFAVGNTAYVQLHQKQAAIQFICTLAMQNNEIIKKEISTLAYSKTDYDNNLKYITTGTLANDQFNLEEYLNWSNSTRNGMAYGLTPYQSPLGFRSDKSLQNFSAMHVLSDLKVLNKEIKNPEDILKVMYSCQNKDGGFGEEPSMTSEVFTTYCVVITAYLLNDLGFDSKKCIDFLQSCQNEDGGYGNAPGYPSDSWHTNLAVMSLHLLDASPLNENQLVNYLLACRNEDGGYAIIPGAESDTFSVFRAVDSLMLLNVEIPEKRKTIEWIHSLESKEGGFAYKHNRFVSFVGSYHAIAALYILGELPVHIEECKKWLVAHQMKDGGLSRSLQGPSDTTDEGFITVQALYMLEQKLNPYWVRIVT